MRKAIVAGVVAAGYVAVNRIIAEVDTRIECNKSYWKGTDYLYDLASLEEHGVKRGPFHAVMELGGCTAILPLLPVYVMGKMLIRTNGEEEASE